MLKVAVVRFPGSNCDFDALRAAERVGDERVPGLAPRHQPAGRRRRDPAGRLQLRRLSPLGRHRAVQPDHAGRPAARGRGRRRARHLQRLPDPVRGPPAARRAHAERGPHVRLEAGGRRRRARGHGLHLGLRRWAPGSGCRSPTATAASWRPTTRCACSRPKAASSCGTSRPRRPRRFSPTRTGPPTTSRASRTPRAPWSASCRIPSGSPTRSSARRTGSDSSLPSRPGSRATPCSGFPANDHRQAQPQRRRVFRQAGCRAAPEAARPGRGRRASTPSGSPTT